jgi:hypothetical protein
LPTEIIPSQILSEFADGIFPSAILPVYTDKIISSVYTSGIADSVKFFFENCNGGMTWILFKRIYRQNIPRDSNQTAKQGRVATTSEINDEFTDGIFRQ